MSFAELLTAKHSMHALVANQVLDDLMIVAHASDDQLLADSAEVLEHWDRQYLAKSKGALLFYKWFEKWIDKTIDNGADFPANGTTTALGVFSGDTYIALVEFSNSIIAQVLMIMETLLKTALPEWMIN